MISGSAVAVSRSALLTSCKAVGTAPRVGIVHGGRYQIARRTAADREGQVCALTVDRQDLDPIDGARRLDDVQPTEPVLGLANQSRGGLLVVRVDLDAPGVGAADLDATTSLGAPEGALLSNAVLIDA